MRFRARWSYDVTLLSLPMQSHMMVTVALVADTHGFLDPRVAAAVALCDYAVHAGDVGCAAVLGALRPRLETVLAIRGNNDVGAKWPEQDVEVLARLPAAGFLDLPGGRLAVVHGDRVGPVHQRHARLRQCCQHARAVVYGHSHRMVCDQSLLPWVLNPGAAGRVRTYGGPSLLVLHAGEQGWRVESQRFG